MSDALVSADVQTLTGAEALVAQLASRGVARIYGVPGGDCSLDIIDAAQARGIDFVLVRNESAAAMMAAAGAEITDSLGVVLTTRGPGLANGVNGVACAMLDRCAIAFISDGYEHEQAFVSHQRFDQQRLLEPIVKASWRIDTPQAALGIGRVLDIATARPRGPVYLEVTGHGMRGRIPATSLDANPAARLRAPAAPDAAIAAAADLIARAKRPVIVAGLQCRDREAARAFRVLASAIGCPVFSTYMGKGALPDADPQMMGHFMAGGAEHDTLTRADLLLMAGVDPIELLPKPWRYAAPVIDLSFDAFDRQHYAPAVSLVGDLAESARRLGERAHPLRWPAGELEGIKSHMRDRARVNVDGVLTPTLLAETACRLLPGNARITVDAGAHMLSIMATFEAKAPFDALISRGLATMGYALPTAIGAALAEPDRPVVAFTGDGGLMMCASELATAAQTRCRLVVVVFNDASIAMIGVKQRQRGFARQGMDYSPSDFALLAAAHGCRGLRVSAIADLEPALKQAFATHGPCVVDVLVDPTSYHEQIRALRG